MDRSIFRFFKFLLSATRMFTSSAIFSSFIHSFIPTISSINFGLVWIIKFGNELWMLVHIYSYEFIRFSHRKEESSYLNPEEVLSIENMF
uniref:Uncharacterized protein n=1 Tax=Strigamia maritima TaxID=126957 RepID=T1IWS9_STRMM